MSASGERKLPEAVQRLTPTARRHLSAHLMG